MTAITPRLSIVIAAYNAAGTISAQLAALVSQTPPLPYEIVVGDNGSTDNTAGLVTEWSARHAEIRLVDASARRGPGAARNIAVAASTGDWIAFCDADDIVGDGWITAVIAELSIHQFVAGRFELHRLRTRSPFMVSWSPQLDALTTLPYLPGFLTAGAGNMAMHREVFESIGGFDEAALTAEDDDLCLRAQLAGYPLTFAAGMVLHVRQRAGLGNVWRQALSYGSGARRLKHKYALVAAALDRGAAQSAVKSVGPRTSPGRMRRVLRVLATDHVASRIANMVWQAAWRRGWKAANLDDVTQVLPREDSR